MSFKREERNFYDAIYQLAFGKESLYFYQNDITTIFVFLQESFWGESLEYKIKLLSKLLYYDSYTNSSIRAELREKSDRLLEYINNNLE